ncbi:hypothetical protein ACFE04_021753 [Oxalis oulophora]
MAVLSPTSARFFSSSFKSGTDPYSSSSDKSNRRRFSSLSPHSPPFNSAAAGFGLSSSMILRFPPNFVRQLSIKARRNCSNIGVAQIVAATWTDGNSGLAAPAASSSAAIAASMALLPHPFPFSYLPTLCQTSSIGPPTPVVVLDLERAAAEALALATEAAQAAREAMKLASVADRKSEKDGQLKNKKRVAGNVHSNKCSAVWECWDRIITNPNQVAESPCFLS